MKSHPSAQIVRALESLQDGDVDFAEAVLESALHDYPAERRFACRCCGLKYEWPGLRWDHEFMVHGFNEDDEDPACAA